jgi:hypothetical protein
MSRTRLILLGLLALVAVGVVATATATATGSCMKVKAGPAYCVEGAPLENASAEVEGTNGASVLKATISTVSSEVKCEKGKLAGTIEGGAAGTVGKSTATMTFEGCKLITPTNCKLTAAAATAIETTELKGELVVSGSAKRIEDKFEPKEGAAFAAIGIEGKEPSCLIAEVGRPKNFNVKGSQLCEVDTSNTIAETEAKTHNLICKNSGSTLEVGGTAEITSEATVKLTSGKKWSVKET